jgi:hypothetical protein
MSATLARFINALNETRDEYSTLEFLMGGSHQLDFILIIVFGAQTYIGDAIMVSRSTPDV